MAEHADPTFFSNPVALARRFHLEPATPPEDGPSVISAGREAYVPGCCIEADGPSCERADDSGWRVLEFVSSGTGEVTLDGRTTALAAGTFFARGPATRCRLVTGKGDSLTKYFVVFAGLGARVDLERHLPALGSVLRTSAPADITEVFDELIRAGLRQSQHVRRMLAVQVERLVLRLAETALPLAARVSPAFLTYHRCRQYIQENWAEISSLEQIARECGVAPAYVCRLFKRFDHQSPYQYLMQQKMTHAADRLVRNGICIKELAYEFGFSDPFHFSRVFRKTMGLAPVHFARVCATRSEAPKAGMNG